MANKKSLLKSAAFSCLAMGLSAAVIAGTTFAWFTDRATTPENKIVAGNLKVQLQYNSAAEGEEAKWESSEFHALFEDTDLWEPGKMVVSEPFRVANVGSLALWYDLSVEMKDEVTVEIDEVEHGLSEVVKCKVVKADEAPTGENRAEEWAGLKDAGISSGKLLKESYTDAVVAVLYWQPTDHDNDYNVEVGEDALETHFFISVLASQIPEEHDSFGPDYDKDAVDSKQTVIDTVTAGVEKMNAAMKNDKGQQYAEMGELTEVEENVYESAIKMDQILAKSTTVGDVYQDIGATLFGEVIAKSALIKSIGFTSEAAEGKVTLIENNGEEIADWELAAGIYSGTLAPIYGFNSGKVDEALALTIDNLAGYTLQVIITTMDDEVVTYNLPFEIVETPAGDIHDALFDGIDAANTAMQDIGLEEQIIFGQFDENNTATCNFVNCTEDDVISGFLAVYELVDAAVTENIENGVITAIKIHNTEVNPEEDPQWIINGLLEWCMELMEKNNIDMSEIGGAMSIAEAMWMCLDGEACTLTITTSDKVTTVYTLAFTMTGNLVTNP